MTDKFSFPLLLNLGAYLPAADADAGAAAAAAAAAEDGGLYELTAILVHKGSAATSGHYGASARSACVRPLQCAASAMADAAALLRRRLQWRTCGTRPRGCGGSSTMSVSCCSAHTL